MDEQKIPTDVDPGAADAAEVPAGRKRKRRWRVWLIVLLVMVLMVVAAVGLAPTVASTQWARGHVLDLVNDRIDGTVAVKSLDLSWFSGCSAEGVEVVDPADRTVVSVARARIPKGVWGLIRSGSDLGRVEIDGARVTAYVDDEYGVSIADAFGEVPAGGGEAPAPPGSGSVSSGGKTQLPSATLVLRDARIEVVRPDGRRLGLSDIDITARTDADGGAQADISATLDNQTVVTATVDVADVGAVAELDPAKITATATVRSSGEVDLGAIGDVLLKPHQVSGLARLDIDATLDGGQATSIIKTGVTGLAWADAGQAGAEPIDLDVVARVNSDGDRVAADVALTGTAGEISAKLDSPIRDLGFDGGRLVESLVAGSPITLADVTVDVTGRVDLARMARAVPKLMRIREGATVTGGVVEITALSVRGGRSASARAALEASGVTVATGSGLVSWQPIEVSADIGCDEGGRLQVNVARINSDFVTLTANGTARRVELAVVGDLAELRRQVGQVIDLGVDRLAGRFEAKVGLVREQDERVDVSLDATVGGLDVAVADRVIRAGSVKIEHRSRLTLENQRIARVDSDRTSVWLDRRVNATISGWYQPSDDGYNASIEVPSTDMKDLASVLAGLGVDQLSDYGGSIQVNAQVAGTGAALESTGSARGRDLRAGGKQVADTLGFEWIKLAYKPSPGVVGMERVRLVSDAVRVEGQAVEIRTGPDWSATGKLGVRGELDRVARVVGSLAGTEPSALAGTLSLDADCRTAGDALMLSGKGQVVGLKVGDLAAEKNPLTFGFDAGVDTGARTIELKQLQLAAYPMSVDLVGSVADYDRDARVDVRGTYEMRLKRLTQWLHEAVPATRGVVSVVGAQRGVIAGKGLVWRADVSPPYRDLTAMMETGFRAARVYGIPLGVARFEPRLEGGVLRLPATRIAAADGFVNLRGRLQLAGEMTLKVPGELKVLDKVKVTPELARDVLSRFNPVFGQATKVAGKIDLVTRDVIFPLGASLTTRGSGGGRLDLHRFRIKPGGLLAELIALGSVGQRDMYAVKVSGADFVIQKGRLRYDDFTMRFGDGLLDLKFYGSVGFDDTLDLVVSIPVRENLLRRLKVTGPVLQYAGLLNDARVDIPIVGTRENPRLDMAKVNVGKLLEGAVKNKGGKIDAGKGLGDLLQVIGGPDGKRKKDGKKGGKKGGRKKRRRKNGP